MSPFTMSITRSMIARRSVPSLAVVSPSSLWSLDTSTTRPFTSSHSRLSAVGYGDPEGDHKDQNKSGKKSPSSKRNPKSGGTTDPERGSSKTPATGGSKKVDAHGTTNSSTEGNKPLPETEKIAEADGHGKKGPPAEEKKVGEKPKTT